MTNEKMEQRLASALEKTAPDDMSGVLSRCEERKGTVIPMTTKKTVNRKWTTLVAACLAVMLLGGFLMLVQSAGFARILGMLGVLAGACLAGAAILRARGRMPNVWLYVVVVLFYVAKLFYDFRHWTVDPAVLDYCFWLFAAIGFMLATFHAAQFCFDLGKRRVLAFFALMGIYFGAVSLADLRGGEALICGGSTLWTLACAWQALRGNRTGKDEQV